MILRDYTYLDTGRLQNYLSGLDQGVVEELTETTRAMRGQESSEGFRADVAESSSGSRSHDETTRARVMRVSAQHMFSRIYDELDAVGLIKVIDEDDPIELNGLRRRQVVELTRAFHPSPMNKAIDGILKLMATMEQMGFVEEVRDEEAEMIRAMAMVFRGDEGEEEIPMVSRGDRDHPSVIFLAKAKYIVVDQNEFEGPMTVFGKVQRLIPEGASIDLFDFLKLPSAIRNESSVKRDLLEMFQSWPKELGGPVAKENMEVKGPALVVTPVATYEA